MKLSKENNYVDPKFEPLMTITIFSLKARLHRRFLSRQLDAIFVALKLHQVSNMLETPATSRRQIALKVAPGLHKRFWSCNFRATKLASSCCNKNRLCKRTFKHSALFSEIRPPYLCHSSTLCLTVVSFFNVARTLIITVAFKLTIS